jgi:peptidoglycan-N-acetylglucosamine deacetylase
MTGKIYQIKLSRFIMKSNITYTVDVEADLHNPSYLGVIEGLKAFEKICDKNKVTPILFVTCNCIIAYPLIFKKLAKKGWGISLHGYTHKRFDEMTFQEREYELKESIKCFKKYLGIKPKGFRAPQHSIDKETLGLLAKYNFEYDSSYTPLNLLQLFFFPEKFNLWLQGFFSPVNPYQIRKFLLELPVSSLIIPPVSLVIRILPKILAKGYFKLLKIIYKKPIFYAHSWDFIELKQSRIDRMFSYKRFLDKLDYLMSETN